jgi:hypothetical protein
MQREHLPLAEIRRRLEELDEDAIRSLAEAPMPAEAPSSAVDYVRAVLGEPSLPPPAAGGRTVRPSADRAQWERIALTPDVEVHVRRPLSREDNRLLEKVLEEARLWLRRQGG